MSSHESLAYVSHGASLTRPVRHVVASALALLGGLLAALARRVDAPSLAPPPPSPMSLEFYADAGAPEGALYVDGELVGHLIGVTRL